MPLFAYAVSRYSNLIAQLLCLLLLIFCFISRKNCICKYFDMYIVNYIIVLQHENRL